MSQENVEVVRGYLADGRAHAEVWDPRGDYYPVQKFPESQPCHGIEEIERFYREFGEAWEHVDLGIEAITPVADDRVLVSAVLAAEGRESRLNLHTEIYYCFWLRRRRVFRQEDHLTLAGALRALGLSGETLEAAGLRESSVSQENVEIVRAMYDAWARNDFPGPAHLLDAQIEYVNPAGAIEPGTRCGLAAFSRAVEQVFVEGYETFRLEPERFTSCGDRVAVVLRYRARGRGSRVEVEGRLSALWTVRGGKVVRFEWFHGPDDALEALGLRG